MTKILHNPKNCPICRGIKKSIASNLAHSPPYPEQPKMLTQEEAVERMRKRMLEDFKPRRNYLWNTMCGFIALAFFVFSFVYWDYKSFIGGIFFILLSQLNR